MMRILTASSLLLASLTLGGCFNYDYLSRAFDGSARDGASDASITPNANVQFGSSIVSATMGTGAASLVVGDFNTDKFVDLAVPESNDTSAGEVALFQGDGTGSFVRENSYAIGKEPQVLVSANLDGDNTPDLAVINLLDETITFIFDPKINQSATTTTLPVAQADLESLAAGDLNNDGLTDLVVSAGAGTVNILLGAGNKTFGAPIMLAVNNPQSAVLQDFDSDGRLDLAVAETGSNDVAVFLSSNRAAGALFGTPEKYASGNQPFFVIAADLDGDGHDDLVASNSSSNNLSVFFGVAGGSFKPQTTIESIPCAFGLAAADLNGDRIVDLVSSNNCGDGVSVVLGAGGRGFRAVQTFKTQATQAQWVTLADVNDDGRLDIIVPSTAAPTLEVLLNES